MEPLDLSHSEEDFSESIEKLLVTLFNLCPLFDKRWKKTRHLLQKVDGSYTPCSILSEFSQYLSDNWDTLKHAQKQDISDWVEEVLTENANSFIKQPIKTCFLDNILHSSCAREMQELAGTQSQKYLEAWDRGSFF
jgi:hypothetical protein